MLKGNEIQIKAISKEGELLSATFCPSAGMNFISYKKGNLEVIDQSTRPLFEERYAGLGAMIGPHFHHRKEIPTVANPALFPHIEKVFAKGTKEPFSHGIGRYAPWKVESVTENQIVATLRGTDKWNGVELKELEGQDFKMEYSAQMLPEGLSITLTVESQKPSIVGLHTYYALPENAVVTSCIQNEYNDHGNILPIPKEWFSKEHDLHYDLKSEFDFGFFPYPDPSRGTITLEGSDRKIRVSYSCPNNDNSWQLWHPKGKSFVCIEPLTAKDPRRPMQTSSTIKILIEVAS